MEIQLRRRWILFGDFSLERQENHLKAHGLEVSV
jgi:hypothetical protein